MEMAEVNSEDWAAECSDEENYKLGPNDIIELYGKISEGAVLELEWKCPGRRLPTPEPSEENTELKEEVNKESETEQKTVVAEFDFDEMPSSGGIVTPRRASVGRTKTPRSNQKRVAQLDKIMSDIRRHRKMDEESRKASSRSEGSSPRPANSRKSSPKAT